MSDAAQRQFGGNAEKYRDEPLFADGQDLQELIAVRRWETSERVLDVGTGAGHTAVALAPYVATCIGVDVTPEMIRIATELAKARGVANASFQVADVQQLPFDQGAFDAVVCRLAAHHFPDVRQSTREMVRVMKPGGTLLLIDHYAPEDDELDEFVNRIDRMRDPSHIREHRLSEWASWFAENDLTFDVKLQWDLRLDYDRWVDRANVPEAMRPSLAAAFREASPACAQMFRITLDHAGAPTTFCLKAAMMVGVKP